MSRSFSQILGPKPALIIGNVLDFASTPPHIRLYQYGRQYGDIVGFWLLNRPNILINEARLIEQVLVTDRDRYYKNAPRPAAEPVIGSSVFLSNDPQCAVKRRDHPFLGEEMRDYFTRICPIIEEQTLTAFTNLATISQTDYRDLYETLVRVCFPIFGLTVFGSPMNEELYRDFDRLMQEMNSRGAQPFPLSLNPQFWQSRRRWFNFIDGQIQARQTHPTAFGTDILSRIISHYTELLYPFFEMNYQRFSRQELEMWL